ncbi:hypothetical protein [Bacillus sp. JJ722]|uniref:hypothetical protein n=1 Tax=Bacillus sp. JJ722 TaxID=3122973 RepID=UPI002FFF041E
MAVLPLKQTVIITRKNEPDEWGEGGTIDTFTLKCRVDEESKLVQNQFGDEVVAGASILFDKLADIRYGDTIEYTNELNITISRSPIRIATVRNIGGKPWLTEVFI